jgi:2-octaprenyl-6-methoxyphenol hydroxylase
MRASRSAFEIAVIGGGATGFAAALAAAIGGRDTVLFAPPASFPPGRTALLMQGSLEILGDLGVSPEDSPHAAPLRSIRIVDATDRLIRAPETIFHASEIGLPAFGLNMPNGELVETMRRRAEVAPALTIVDNPVDHIEHDDAGVLLTAKGAQYRARLVIAADGARSVARAAAGISARTWAYRQSVLVATLAIAYPHGGISTEFHTTSGPLTLVPLAGDRISIVWVDRPERAEAVAALAGGAFSQAAAERAQFVHGAMQADSQPHVYALSAALADRFAARRTMLVGEAAHVFPPIGAQGLNLGLRDVAALMRVLARHRSDPGAAAALDAYHAARQADVRSRTLAVDLLNRSLLTGFLPVQLARGLGMAAVSAVPALRRALMRQGLAGGAQSAR